MAASLTLYSLPKVYIIYLGALFYNGLLSLTQPQAEECADAPFDVVQGKALLVAVVGEIEYKYCIL